MRVVHDNFLTLPVKARELTLPVQKAEEMKNLLSCVTTAQGDMSPKHPLSLTSITPCIHSRNNQEPCHN